MPSEQETILTKLSTEVLENEYERLTDRATELLYRRAVIADILGERAVSENS